MKQSNGQQAQTVEMPQQDFEEYFKEFLQYDKVYQEEIRILCATISNDHRFMAGQDKQFRLILWDLETFKYLRFYKIKQVFIEKMLFSHDSKFLIFSFNELSPSCDIQIFQVNQQTAKPYVSLVGHNLTVTSMIISSDSNYLLSGGDDESIKLWNLNEFQSIYSYSVSNKIAGVIISENQRFFACMCYDGWAYLFTCRNMKKTHQILKWRTCSLGNSQIINFNQFKCSNMLFTQDSQKLITCMDEQVIIWVMANKEIRILRQIQMDFPFHLPFQLLIINGRFISKYQYYRFESWDIQTGEQFEEQRSLGIAATVTKDYGFIAISEYNFIKIYKRRGC